MQLYRSHNRSSNLNTEIFANGMFIAVLNIVLKSNMSDEHKCFLSAYLMDCLMDINKQHICPSNAKYCNDVIGLLRVIKTQNENILNTKQTTNQTPTPQPPPKPKAKYQCRSRRKPVTVVINRTKKKFKKRVTFAPDVIERYNKKKLSDDIIAIWGKKIGCDHPNQCNGYHKNKIRYLCELRGRRLLRWLPADQCRSKALTLFNVPSLRPVPLDQRYKQPAIQPTGHSEDQEESDDDIVTKKRSLSRCIDDSESDASSSSDIDLF